MKLGFHAWVKVLLAVLIEEIAVTLLRKSKKSRGDDRASDSSAREESSAGTATGTFRSTPFQVMGPTLHIMADGTGLLTEFDWERGCWVDRTLSQWELKVVKQRFGVLFD